MGVICGDSEFILKKFETNFFELVITSPPYGNAKDYDGLVKYEDYEDYLLKMKRLSRE